VHHAAIRFWNGGAERIFGFGEAEALLGRSLDLIVPETLRPRHWAAFHETMRTGRTRYGEGGRLSGIVAVVRDATKRGFEETTALRKELARLRAAGPG
jgi:PAS domain-containing protein